MNHKNNIAVAEAYYTEMSKKNIANMKKHLHPDVQFTSPLAKTVGREAVLEAAKGFTSFFKSLNIRTTISSEDQVVLIYDVDFPAPIGKLPAASLMTFQEGLISRIELFFDARSFDKK